MVEGAARVGPDVLAFGRSMEPVIPSGSLLTIELVDCDRIELGYIVMARLGDETMLHLVKAIDRKGRRFEILRR